MLELKNISKSYGTQLILDNISLKVQESEMVSILGPSGSGKSSLLQIMGLLMKPDMGTVSLDQVAYHSLTEKDQTLFRNQKLGFVFQFHHLLGEFTCEENIKFPLFIKGTSLTEEDEVLFDKIVQTLGIQAVLRKLPSQISGGEQQRVAVARALINRPTLLLADEPTGNLDNKNAETLYDLFVELKAVWQQRIIMVTHNEKLTSQSDQVIYLNSGRIE